MFRKWLNAVYIYIYIYPNSNTIPLIDQKKFILNKINEMKDYFVAEIKKRELMSKRLSKYMLLRLFR